MYNLELISVLERKLGLNCSSNEHAFLCIDHLTPLLFIGTGKTVYQCQLSTDAIQLDIPIESPIVGLEYLPDQSLLFVITLDGDVITYDPLTSTWETVGCVSNGLLCGAWSPDFELVALQSAENLLIMNREFDVLVETCANPVQTGIEIHESVGWGKKETQFQGSVGKQAAFDKPEECTVISPLDDKCAKISWRGDGLYFCVSTVCPNTSFRTIRVWSREGQLCSTCEPTTGLQHTLQWKPSGSLIASTRCKEGEPTEVVFFERNGYKHGRVPLRIDQSKIVESVHWNCDSSILSVLILEKDSKNSTINLYTCRNMYWSLKQSIALGSQNHPVFMIWDSEQCMIMHAVLSNGAYLQLQFRSCVSHDNTQRATAAIIDADCIKVTPFSRALVPPPMSLFTFKCASPVNQIVFVPESSSFYCLLNDYTMEFWEFSAEKDEFIRKRSCRLDRSLNGWVYHVKCIGENSLAWIEYSNAVYHLVIAKLSDDENEFKILFTDKLDASVLFMKVLGSCLYLLDVDGFFESAEYSTEAEDAVKHLNYEEVSNVHAKTPSGQSEVVSVLGQVLCLNLSSSHVLSANNMQICGSVACFLCHENFLLYTTLQHQLFCIPWETIIQNNQITCEGREIERGSTLIACTESMLILQAPRGNLEVIHPRPLLLRIIAQLIDQKRYRETLIGMKRHRINSNLLYDHNPQMFMDNLEHFVTSIKDPLMLELFLSEIKDEDTTLTLYKDNYPQRNGIDIVGKQCKVCDAIRNVLCEMESLPVALLPALLITYARQGAHLIEDALVHVKKIANESSESTVIYDTAIRHLLYLVDAEELYRVALGTYDFELVLLVAEKSQKDPKEYLPFLNELRSVHPECLRKYKVDMHLQRYEKALRNLVQEEDNEMFDLFTKLMIDKCLYSCAMKMWPKSSSNHKKICELYGDYLSKRRHDADASVLYEIGGCHRKALDCSLNAADHKSVLRLAKMIELDKHKLNNILLSLVQKFLESKDYEKAANIYEYELGNVNGAFELCCDGLLWDNARLLTQRYNLNSKKMVEHLVEHANSSLLLFESLRGQLITYTSRLQFVRNEKSDKWDRICQGEDIDDTRSEAFSEASSIRSASSTSTSRTTPSYRSGRLNRKQEKRRVTLKEGSRFEDTALLVNIRAVIGQVNALQQQVKSDLRALFLNENEALAHTFHASYNALHTQCKKSIAECWPSHWKACFLPGPIDPQQINAFGDTTSINEAFEGLLLDAEIHPPGLESSKGWDVHYLMS